MRSLAAVALAAVFVVPVRASSLPDVLSPADEQRYRKIFAFQEKADWRAADGLIDGLEDRILLGHVLAQRYLYPDSSKYRSRFEELARWMKAYADNPDARRIYRLAKRRQPKGARVPRKPASRLYHAAAPAEIIERAGYRPAGRAARRILARVRNLVGRDRLTVATRYVSGNRKILGVLGYELARTRIAAGWFFYGNAGKAFEMAQAAAERSAAKLPYAHWIAGLSAFRLGRYDDASHHFAAVANSTEIAGGDRAAGAFWAARASLRGGKPERVSSFLGSAAREPWAFYGILARRWLGGDTPLDWRSPAPNREELARVTGRKSGLRALALIQVGRFARADRELRFMIDRNDPDVTEAVASVAESARLPMASLRAARALLPERVRARALYPEPSWRPRGGFSVDRALIYALMRQESAFYVRARSRAGARGLMQLMPATASYIEKRRFRGPAHDLLYDPALNISVGQKYVRYLLENEHIGGDLLLMAAAYNGGPGNLRKWKRKARYEDPLMFIESMPLRETRIFVERVLSNLWMYRERFGEPAPSLDALAANRHPLYLAVEGAAANVRH